MDITTYLNTLDADSLAVNPESQGRFRLSEIVDFYNDESAFPDLENYDVTIIGVEDDRGTTSKGCDKAPGQVRQWFYSLFTHWKNLKIIDLGNIKSGHRIDDTYFALKEVVSELLKNNVVIIIGAMVIAPLLGPNVAFALAATLGDFKLGIRAMKVLAAGIVTALALSMLFGYLFPVDTTSPELLARTRVSMGDIVIAIASGCAGTLAFTMGVSSALVGVMIAVALLPPLVTLGLLIGSANFDLAVGTTILFLTSIN